MNKTITGVIVFLLWIALLYCAAYTVAFHIDEWYWFLNFFLSWLFWMTCIVQWITYILDIK